MWFEWLVRRCDMGAFAAVCPLQPPSGVDQQGSENAISQSAPDVASLWSRRKAERRAPAPHVFPPLPGPAVVANELVSSPVWSPCFDNSLCKDYHAGPGGQKALSISLPSSEGGPWVSELAKNYLQTVQELKQSRFSETPLEPERYRELKAGFWKRLAADSLKDEPCDSASVSGAPASVESGTRSSNPSAKRATLSRSQGRGGPGLNGSVEIEVVLTGKWNANTVLESEALIVVPKPDSAGDPDAAETVACNPCGKDIRHRDGIDDPRSPVERDRDDDVCRTGASSREASDGESLEGDVDANHARCEPGNPQQRQQDGSECSFGSGGGIGRGRIGEDGSPTSTSSNRQACDESKASAGNLECNRKEDGTFWSSANWCVVDSYMTGHGKETTWTVRGFEEDDGIFEGNSPDCKDRSPLKLFASEKNHSRFSDLPVTQFLPVEAPDVETRHGPPPKWTQQALQERVAQNLREQQKETVRSSRNGLDIVRSPAQKHTEESMDADDGGRDEEAECREVVLDDPMSVGDMLHCRKGRKLLKEAVLKETRDKVGGGDMEAASPDMNDIDSASWKSVGRSSNACVGPSTYRSDQDKELLNLVSRREIRRRRRGWAKRKAQLPATAVACCVSMIGDTVKALRRTREDAAALALELSEVQTAEVKDFKAAASAMRSHVDLLRSEVKVELQMQGLETERGFNVLMVFPWQQFLRNIVIGISLVSGTLGLHRAIKSLFRLLFGRVVQTATSRKEKTMVAMVILCSGSYVGKEIWQIFSQVQAKKKRNDAVFQEKLRLVLERLSLMSTLTYKNGTVHQGQAEESEQTV